MGEKELLVSGFIKGEFVTLPFSEYMEKSSPTDEISYVGSVDTALTSSATPVEIIITKAEFDAKTKEHKFTVMSKIFEEAALHELGNNLDTVYFLINKIIPLIEWDFIPIEYSSSRFLASDTKPVEETTHVVSISGLDDHFINRRIIQVDAREKAHLYKDWEEITLVEYFGECSYDELKMIVNELKEFYIKVVSTSKPTLVFSEGDTYCYKETTYLYSEILGKFVPAFLKDTEEFKKLSSDNAKRKTTSVAGGSVTIKSAKGLRADTKTFNHKHSI